MPTTDDATGSRASAELRAPHGRAAPGHSPEGLRRARRADERVPRARSPFCLLATSDADGNLEVSPKGDGAGFVLLEDPRSLVLPDRKGNKLLFGLQNILANPNVALIFLVPGTDETLRVQRPRRAVGRPGAARAPVRARPAGADRDPHRRRALLLPLRARVPARRACGSPRAGASGSASRSGASSRRSSAATPGSPRGSTKAIEKGRADL